MRTAGQALLLLALSACAEEKAAEAEAPPAGLSVVLQSEDVVDRTRPVLNLSCAPGAGSFWLGLVRTPEAPPPPRGIFGAIKVDDGAPVRIELTWLGADRWAPRLDLAQEAALVQAMLRGRNVYFSGPEGETDRAYRWDLARMGPGAEQMRRSCG